MEKFENTDIFEKEKTELANFIETESYTASDMEEAYYDMLGISDKDVSEKIKILSAKMKEITDNGFPLNQLTRLIGLKERWENMVSDYISFVENMSISSNEKRMLKSIVDDDRLGELSIYIDGKSIGDFKIESLESKEAKSYQLINFLKEAIKIIPDNKKIEFSFTED